MDTLVFSAYRNILSHEYRAFNNYSPQKGKRCANVRATTLLLVREGYYE